MSEKRPLFITFIFYLLSLILGVAYIYFLEFAFEKDISILGFLIFQITMFVVANIVWVFSFFVLSLLPLVGTLVRMISTEKMNNKMDTILRITSFIYLFLPLVILPPIYLFTGVSGLFMINLWSVLCGAVAFFLAWKMLLCPIGWNDCEYNGGGC